MDRSLQDAVCIVTGGARGIGHCIANTLLQNGAKTVILLDIKEEEGRNSEKLLSEKHGDKKARFIKCDITKDLDAIVDKIIEEYKTVDVLVNSAGIGSDFKWKKTMDVNATYLIGCCIKFWQHMRQDVGGKGGTIINISSVYGYRVTSNCPVYHASKFAIIGFTKSLGHYENFSKSGVRVFALCPGYTETMLKEEAEVLDEGFFLESFRKTLMSMECQQPEAVGCAIIETFQRAASGSVWTVEAGSPVAEVVTSTNHDF